MPPMATYIFKEDVDRNTNTSVGGHLGVGRGFSDDWAVEFSLVGNSSDAWDEVNQWGLGVDLIEEELEKHPGIRELGAKENFYV